jgi:hypothetical protein
MRTSAKPLSGEAFAALREADCVLSKPRMAKDVTEDLVGFGIRADTVRRSRNRCLSSLASPPEESESVQPVAV